ncbi:MAG TPA: cupin domain-containing protein [Chloroflexota bacterium]|nr:cupin domain-containing protein [Chloroflexota bacterium]
MSAYFGSLEDIGSGRVSAGIGPAYWVGNELITIKASGREIGNAFALMEDVTAPHGGAPVHVHTREDEAFYVVEGRFLFQRGDQEFTATPGMCVMLPKGIPHTYVNIGNGQGKLLVIAIPAGLEDFFAEAGQIGARPAAPPSKEQLGELIRVAGKYGIEITGSPLG